ncbi:hypothetical protein N5D83_02710 [Pseudomonas chengduensis]|nr:hypothetical protein [Pseudomonas chengduensis]MDH1865729.1 hypothetical protein [Pseudomonas chengduensis]
MNVDDFVQTNAPDGVLSPEQARQLEQLLDSGDTGVEPEQGGQPVVTPELVAETEDVQEPEVDPANAVIMAKDNVHQIPYQKLLDSRESERHWKQQAQQEQQLRQEEQRRHQQALDELAALKADAQARADAGQAPTQADMNAEIAQQAIDAGVDPAVFGDMDEEGLAKGVQAIAQQVHGKAIQPLLDEIKVLKDQLAPINQRQAEDANTAHFAAIREKHPDFESIAESQELEDWINAQPSFVRDQMTLIVQGGSAAQAIELLDAFKARNGQVQAAPEKDARATAKEMIDKAKPAAPVSLSDIPGGRAAASSRFEAIESMGREEKAAALADMPLDQVEAYLNRTM